MTDDYDPLDDLRKSYDLCISEMRKRLVIERTVKDKTALAYFVEEDGQIFLCVKAEEIGFWRFPVTPEKVLDVVSEGARLARLALSKR
jgi:hypothetical protein